LGGFLFSFLVSLFSGIGIDIDKSKKGSNTLEGVPHV